MEITIWHAFAFLLILKISSTISYKIFSLFFDDRKTFWIVEDSTLDRVIYQNYLDSTKYHIKYYTSLSNLGWRVILERPAGVIVDYCLPGVCGEELYRHCKQNKTPAIIVTGLPKRFINIQESDLVIKDARHSHLEKVKNWIQSQVLAA